MTDPDLQSVDELCRLVVTARSLGCGVHLTDVDPDLKSLLDLAGVSGVLCTCPTNHWLGDDDPGPAAADLP